MTTTNSIDPLYKEVKEKILQGKNHLPYRDYIFERASFFIANVATYEELEQLQKVIDQRYLQEYESKETIS